MEARRRKRQPNASKKPATPRRGAAPSPDRQQRRPKRVLRRTRGCLGVVGVLAAMAVGATAANAYQIRFTFNGEPQPASGALSTGPYNVVFLENSGKAGGFTGAIERGGAVIAEAPLPPARGATVLDATLQAGDVARLSDPRFGNSLSTTFTGYPAIISAQCGSRTLSGVTAPGQEVIGGRFNHGVGTVSVGGNADVPRGNYTMTFEKPITPGAIVYVVALSFGGGIQNYTEVQARATSPCLSVPPGESSKPKASTVKCVVPNLKHKTLKQARKMLSRAHCRLGKVRTLAKHGRHRLIVVRQKPAAKTVMPAGGRVSLSLTTDARIATMSHLVAAAAATTTPKTAFQCEKRFKSSQGRERCFSQLPGASCAHPLVAEKAGNTTRGEHRYFRLGFRGDPYSGGVELHYSYAPATSNVAMCPYPVGAVYKDSLYSDETHCQAIHRNGHVEEYCSSEYDTHNHPEPVGRSGGSFTFDLKPPRGGYLVVKGYFIHPPWEHRG